MQGGLNDGPGEITVATTGTTPASTTGQVPDEAIPESPTERLLFGTCLTVDDLIVLLLLLQLIFQMRMVRQL